MNTSVWRALALIRKTNTDPLGVYFKSSLPAEMSLQRMRIGQNAMPDKGGTNPMRNDSKQVSLRKKLAIHSNVHCESRSILISSDCSEG